MCVCARVCVCVCVCVCSVHMCVCVCSVHMCVCECAYMHGDNFYECVHASIRVTSRIDWSVKLIVLFVRELLDGSVIWHAKNASLKDTY